MFLGGHGQFVMSFALTDTFLVAKFFSRARSENGQNDQCEVGEKSLRD